ncbi:MAG: 30S ribosome-binding factor RbfA [Bifidobacteriaceae bacterium]|jgi:ribosome-binding factor A|nr:30S ribosome-binding factor RbfA [Bifidobacteriaceae bacterium]
MTNPRAVRIAGLVKRVIAQSIETELHDPRLAGVTITDVRVTNDMQIAHVFWTQLGDPDKAEGQRHRAAQALQQAKGRLRSHVGAKAGLRLTPVLEFRFDEVPGEATEIEDILTVARKRDEELAKARATAQYAGDEDPYKHPDEAQDDEESDESEDSEDSEDFNDSDDSEESTQE